ncbi:hypothetical protein DFA_06504 [Cavenderia fasciculata]|uniref:Fungal lipase-type domain-containing protein n=1 Tax=Cavenderia fasciculata TaxID=261658 RepID=F4PJ68_CACFS|nr:uncharacterized protein DFA_06504 [Cavenderia fasciculata]EGG24354.1 hypothetical protein DFA_06504 [Cavenderia fasciculata]|eukprot:XP_004362205.1 hypothetical protein DFA_06504 [Cavenderia fasciculata]
MRVNALLVQDKTTTTTNVIDYKDYIFALMSETAANNQNQRNHTYLSLNARDSLSPQTNQQSPICYDFAHSVNINTGHSRMIISKSVLSNTIIISFSSTFPIDNYLNDPELVECPFKTKSQNCGGMFKGIVNEYLEMKDDLTTFLHQLDSVYDVYVTGYSFGGSLALVCATDLLARPIDDIGRFYSLSLVTFGQPPIGDKQFIQFLQGGSSNSASANAAANKGVSTPLAKGQNDLKSKLQYRRYATATVTANTNDPIVYDSIIDLNQNIFYHPQSSSSTSLLYLPITISTRTTAMSSGLSIHSLHHYLTGLYSPLYSPCRSSSYYSSSSVPSPTSSSSPSPSSIYTNRIFHSPMSSGLCKSKLIININNPQFDKYSICLLSYTKYLNYYQYNQSVSCANNLGTDIQGGIMITLADMSKTPNYYLEFNLDSSTCHVGSDKTPGGGENHGDLILIIENHNQQLIPTTLDYSINLTTRYPSPNPPLNISLEWNIQHPITTTTTRQDLYSLKVSWNTTKTTTTTTTTTTTATINKDIDDIIKDSDSDNIAYHIWICSVGGNWKRFTVNSIDDNNDSNNITGRLSKVITDIPFGVYSISMTTENLTTKMESIPSKVMFVPSNWVEQS